MPDKFQYDVKDIPAERGIKLNNYISSGILSVLAWMGYNIDGMKNSLAQVQLNNGVMQVEIEHLHETVSAHKADCAEKFKKLGIE